jgi:DNA (cytosine-5)-methyltransferase 1
MRNSTPQRRQRNADEARKPLTFGSLFAGIGGFDLGFERAGMQCKWQVEIDPYCQKVLAKHWPNVRRWDDVRTFPPAGDWGVDCICGGPPCQPTSHAGLQLGDKDPRWMWPDTIRIIRTMGPRYVVLENPPALLSLDGGRAFGSILGALANCGLDAEWDVLPAGAFGLPHFRERLFVVAYTNGEGRARVLGNLKEKCNAPFWKEGGIVRKQSALESYRGVIERLGYDIRKPGTSGTANGIPSRVHRLRGCGNAVAPVVAQWIGERIVEAANA